MKEELEGILKEMAVTYSCFYSGVFLKDMRNTPKNIIKDNGSLGWDSK